jgi:hypothetical protein
MAGCNLFEQRLNHRRTPEFLTDENEGNEDTGIFALRSLRFLLFVIPHLDFVIFSMRVHSC